MTVDLLKTMQATETRARLDIEKGLKLRGMVSETGKAPSYLTDGPRQKHQVKNSLETEREVKKNSKHYSDSVRLTRLLQGSLQWLIA